MKDNNPIKQMTFGCCIDKPIEQPLPIETLNKKGYVDFGEDNQYPQFLFDCYSQCSLLQSLCNGVTDYVCGNGFEERDLEDMRVSKSETLEGLVKRCTLDYVIFGAMAVQCTLSKTGLPLEWNYVDVQKVRLDDEDKKVYIHSKWDRYSRNIIVYDRYDTQKAHPTSIFYFKNPKSRGIYGLPIWSSAVKDVQTDIEITQFHLSTIQNGFFSPFIVNMNNGQPSEEDADRMEQRITDKFVGSRNAGKFILSFNNSKDNAADIVGIPSDNFDQKYNALSEKVKENILTSFRASSQLFGVSSQSTGFSSIEYQDSYALFSATVIKPIQHEIERAFDMILPETYHFHLRDFVVKFNDTQSMVPSTSSKVPSTPSEGIS